MADLTTVEDNFFAVASETYSDNLSATISSLASEVPVNSAADYDDGDVVTLVVEPGTTNEAVFTGVKASTPDRFTECKWTEGNIGVGHSSGATVVDYVTATHLSMMTKGLKVAHEDNGDLKTTAVQKALNITSAVPPDWTALAQTVTTVVPNGNRSYTLTFPGVNYTDRLSPGMRLRTVRQTAAPNQSASFDGVNDYFSKSSPNGMTFTDDYTAMGWIKLSDYPSSGGGGAIISRYNGTGWLLRIHPDGRINIYGAGGGGAREFSSKVSVPLDEWVHIAGTLDMSGNTANIYINGELVPSSGTGAGTSITQAGNLEVGTYSAGQFFPGKIAQAAVFSAVLTQATIRGYMSQGLLGSEVSLVSAYSLNNSINDLNTTNGNNLTANGGVLATSADSPFGGQGIGEISTTVDYSIIQKSTYSTPDTTVIVQVAEGCTIPTSGGVASVSYASARLPYQFPGQKAKWRIQVINRAGNAGYGGGVTTQLDGVQLTLPVGSWNIRYELNARHFSTAILPCAYTFGVSTSSSSFAGTGLPYCYWFIDKLYELRNFFTREFSKNITTPTTYYLMGSSGSGGNTTAYGIDSGHPCGAIYADNGYL